MLISSRKLVVFLSCFFLLCLPSHAQQTLGGINGTATDSSGGVMQAVKVSVRNTGTNLEVKGTTNSDGSFSFVDLPLGTYEVTFAKDGFKTEVYSQILVQGNRTTTVKASLQPGEVSVTVTVTGTPLMDETDTTNGYVIDTQIIQDTPLGTGSFTQLAILSPGVHADFLGGAGSNAGLGNQAIFANGNRDTSNSFSLNGTNTNNLFNGNSTSQVGENRFVLNTGENFGSAGGIQTSTSVYGAIGQALPTPPPDAIQEIAVNASMYDATQGNNSGAHISVITKSGTNALHGSVWEQFQNSAMNATPFFYNAANIPIPFLNRNQFGVTAGGPIKKDKVFFFGSYQGVRIADAETATKDTTVPYFLTSDRSAQGIANAINASFFPGCGPGQTPANPCFQASQVNTAAMNLLNAKLPNGQFLFPNPSPQFTNLGPTAGLAKAQTLGFDAVVQGPNSHSSVNQVIGGVDYALSQQDHLSTKYYYQNNPTTNPFGAVGSLLGFAQQLSAGSQVVSINNTIALSSNTTWEQHVGFTRLRAYANTHQDFSPGPLGIGLLGSATFPQFEITTADPTIANGVEFGPSTSFGDAGMFQNQWGGGSSLNLLKGKHMISVGGEWNHTQLNIVNNNTNTDTLHFTDFVSFAEGNVRDGTAFEGSASRYYRSDTGSLFVNDSFKFLSNLTITGGVRWDFDGPLAEKYGRLTSFDPTKYKYIQCAVNGQPGDPGTQTCDAGTDVITNSGLLIAGNNKTGATPGASDSLMKNHQWGFAPRIGIAWTPFKNITVRTGYGIYFDRGELFSYLSPSAGSGFNGPFGVTLAPPFVQPISAAKGASLSQPFGTTLPTPPPVTGPGFLAYLPNLQQTACGFPGCWPSGNLFGPLLFGGYDTYNKLPYTQNWTLDVQYQFANNWLFEVGYVGNHGTHLVLPIPFNQPLIATGANRVNGQTSSYGGTTPLFLDTEPVFTNEFSGNAPLRVPFPGYDMNAVLYEAEGTSNYNALQVQVRKRLSYGLQLTGSYTWSHALDEQSGLGLFFTGNNPLAPKSNYASSDFDQTHVFLINYSYTIPNLVQRKALGYAVNGWVIGGQTVAESGQPYSVYDFSGSVGSLYFGTFDFITNPLVPLKPGVTPAQAKLQGTTGVNAGKPVLNAADFAPQFVAPGTNGVPACDATGCDMFESLYGGSGRNLFRGPFQVRFDMSLAKEFPIKERFRLRFEADAFNMFNHPDFDAPNNNVVFFPNFAGPPTIPPQGSLGVIQHTVGSPRFLQLGLHLTF